MKLVKKFIPDLIKNYINTILKRRIILKNNYSSWNSALKNSNGYNYNLIFQETKKSFEKVISQKAKFERDSVLFYESDPDKKLISIIKRLYKKNTINICDIGGSLGSLYFQNIDFLDKKKIIWKIVEQKHYVKYANKNINIKNLKFYCSVNSVLKNKVDLVIFSSVLQYLEFPDKLLDKISKKKIKNLIISRTPFHTSNDVIKIQEVPKNIYKASYPVRVFNKNKFLKKMKNRGFKIKKRIKISEKLDDINYHSFYFIRN